MHIDSERDDRLWAVASYILHLLGAVFGLPSLIGLVINYLKEGVSGPVLDSHHAWMIRTFWWSLAWGVLAVVTWFVGVGILIAALVWLWFMYRHIRGLIVLSNNRPMPR
ncbi:MAG: hypothetical protein PVJ40_05620 [Gammaproteobacteria bacterium]